MFYVINRDLFCKKLITGLMKIAYITYYPNKRSFKITFQTLFCFVKHIDTDIIVKT